MLTGGAGEGGEAACGGESVPRHQLCRCDRTRGHAIATTQLDAANIPILHRHSLPHLSGLSQQHSIA